MSLVEYHDPDNVFNAVLKQLAPRLPLTNLHWKSASRPLRSISNLHVEFVSASDKTAEDSGAASSNDINAQSDRPDEDGAKYLAPGSRPQRHQIAGLRQTPYLKLYLLRCDDKESYKTKSRDLVREWMKSNVQSAPRSASSLAQNDHDAFEWLILHVVEPETPAASEPRWSKKASEQEVPKERSSTAGRWPGKSPRTILERLRSDFNQSGKSAPDRIAQIRLPKSSVVSAEPSEEQPSENGQPDASSQDGKNELDDLISKLKLLILGSFDLRVSQYEEDIREKEGLKSLPGWNFCTFFVLKEGLARAFENVGVLDDALLGYDELDVGLDSIVRDLAYGPAESQATSFLKFTPDLKSQIAAVYRSDSKRLDDSKGLFGLTQLPLDASKKDYRALIVANDISMYDMKSYIFTKQMEILLQLTGIVKKFEDNGTAVQEEKSTSTHSLQKPHSRTARSVRNAMALADLCRRAVKFIPTIARILRVDLTNGFGEAATVAEDLETMIDYAVHSHTFSIAQQTLDETSVFESLVRHIEEGQAEESNYRYSESNSGRRPSLPHIPQPTPNNSSGTARESWFLQNLKDISVIQNTELADVAASRAQMYIMQKRALDAIGKYHGLTAGINEVSSHETPENELQPPFSEDSSNSAKLWNCQHLSSAIESAEAFNETSERLINLAARNYALSNHSRSAEKLILDLAKLKLESKDFTSAAAYFNQILPSPSIQSWSDIESSALQSYAECLKSMGRLEEYVRILLTLLAKVAQENSFTQFRRKPPRQTRAAASRDQSASQNFDTKSTSLVNELIASSHELSDEIQVPFEPYFKNLDLKTNIEVFEGHDGFKMVLKVQQLIAERLTIDEVTVKLIDPHDSQAPDIILKTTSAVELDPGVSEIQLQTNMNVTGYFILDMVLLRLGRVVFMHEPVSKTSTMTVTSLVSHPVKEGSSQEKKTHILAYQRSEALCVNVVLERTIHIGQVRSFHVLMETGGNEIENASLVIRSTTAGLRIHTAESKVVSGPTTILDNQQTGQIHLGASSSNSKVVIRIPYNLERNLSELSVRLEVSYTTPIGKFMFISSPVVPVELALDVGVQDFFKREYIYSKFLIQPGTKQPVHILESQMSGSGDFDAEPLLKGFQPLIVFPQQPAAVTFRIARNTWHNSSKQAATAKTTGMILTVTYSILQEDICAQILASLLGSLRQTQFAQLQYLIERTIKKAVPTCFNVDVCEATYLSKQIELPSLKELGCLDVIEHLPSDDAQSLDQWMKSWHAQNSTIQLLTPSDKTYTSISSPSKLIIDVSVPQLHYLHTTALRLLKGPSPNPEPTAQHSVPTVRVGETIHLELTIRATRRWDYELKSARRDFLYEIQADLTQWQIIGNQTAPFSLVTEDEAYTEPVSLIPLKTGTLFLPTVDVRFARSRPARLANKIPGKRGAKSGEDKEVGGSDEEGDHDQGRSAEVISARELLQANDEAEAEGVRCQTECLSLHSRVVVVAGARSTTVAIGAESTEDADETVSDGPRLHARLVAAQPWEGSGWRS